MAKLTIDGVELEVPDGTRLFDACQEARGEALPHFCYHPDLSIAGVCRLCQVEIEGMPKLTIACNTTVRDGMVVHTRNERVTQANKQVLELHLINHPVDCPICDQAGECGLQDQYMAFGLYDTQVAVPEKVNKDKTKVIGPYVILDKERCVLCSRCVRFCNEVTKTGEMGIFNRGDRAEVDVAPGTELDNNYSLNTVDICPVGALTCRDFRFRKRVWMLKSTQSLCPGCATGCNVRIDHEGGRIYRLKPRHNSEVNGPWMCDRGRMTYKQVHNEKRVGQPLTGDPGQLDSTSWQEALDAAAVLLGQGRVGLLVTSARRSLEEMFLLQRLAQKIGGGKKVVAGRYPGDDGEGDDLLLKADHTPNARGLTMLGIDEITPAALAAAIDRAEGTILIHGGDPAASAEVAGALAGKEMIYIGTHNNATTELASLVLPGSMWAEDEGIFVNFPGRLQGFRRAVVPVDQARPDWRILSELSQRVGAEEVPGSLAAWRKNLSGEVFAGQDVDLNQLPAAGLIPGAQQDSGPQGEH